MLSRRRLLESSALALLATGLSALPALAQGLELGEALGDQVVFGFHECLLL